MALGRTLSSSLLSSSVVTSWSSIVAVTPSCCRKSLQVRMMPSNGNIFCVTGPLLGNPSVTGGFPSQRQVTRGFDIFFDLRLYKRSRRRWFETPLCSLWCHLYGIFTQWWDILLQNLAVKPPCLTVEFIDWYKFWVLTGVPSTKPSVKIKNANVEIILMVID